ncbi:MAG: Fe-S cluster biogenesis protein NfuA [Myxococcota bacterium]|jgi:Fe-S cluster biogenesis protein NfuA
MHPSPDVGALPVRAVETPNPNARMFRVNETLIPTGTHEFTSLENASNSPLASVLLAIEGVELVLIAPRFVTARKALDAQWAWLSPTITAAIASFLRSGDVAVIESSTDGAGLTPVERSEVELRIIALLDEEVRPAIAQDGGDCTFEGFKDGVVYLRLIGACGTCPSSTATLKFGIERLMQEEIPEVKSVESVADGGL